MLLYAHHIHLQLKFYHQPCVEMRISKRKNKQNGIVKLLTFIEMWNWRAANWVISIWIRTLICLHNSAGLDLIIFLMKIPEICCASLDILTWFCHCTLGCAGEMRKMKSNDGRSEMEKKTNKTQFFFLLFPLSNRFLKLDRIQNARFKCASCAQNGAKLYWMWPISWSFGIKVKSYEWYLD